MMHSVISLSVAPNCVVLHMMGLLMLTMWLSLLQCGDFNLLRSPCLLPSYSRLGGWNAGLYTGINCGHHWFCRRYDEEFPIFSCQLGNQARILGCCSFPSPPSHLLSRILIQ